LDPIRIGIAEIYR